MKKLLMLLFTIMILFSGSTAYVVDPENIEQDYTDYQIQKSIFQTLSALPNGDLFGEPDKVKKFTLRDGMTKLQYPTSSTDMVILYHVYAPATDCPQFTSCIRQEKITTKKREVFDRSGKDQYGNEHFDISNYVLNGASFIEVEYHYVVEESNGEEYEETFYEYPLKDFKIKNSNQVYQTWVVDSSGSKEDKKVRTCDEIAILTQNGAGYQCITIEENSNIIGQNNDGTPIYKDQDSGKEVKTGTDFIDDLFDNAQYNLDNGYVEMQNGQCPSGYVGISTEKGVKCTEKVVNDQANEEYDQTQNDSYNASSLILVTILGLAIIGFFNRKKIERYLKK